MRGGREGERERAENRKKERNVHSHMLSRSRPWSATLCQGNGRSNAGSRKARAGRKTSKSCFVFPFHFIEKLTGPSKCVSESEGPKNPEHGNWC